MATIKKTKTIRLDPSLINELEKLAKENNRNFNNYVETILIREVKKQTKI